MPAQGHFVRSKCQKGPYLLESYLDLVTLLRNILRDKQATAMKLNNQAQARAQPNKYKSVPYMRYKGQPQTREWAKHRQAHRQTLHARFSFICGQMQHTLGASSNRETQQHTFCVCWALEIGSEPEPADGEEQADRLNLPSPTDSFRKPLRSPELDKLSELSWCGPCGAKFWNVFSADADKN
jgi:hypothetical protein